MMNGVPTRILAGLIALAGPALAVPAFFHAAVPFWVAGLPLIAGLWAGTPLARAAAMGGWLAVPAATSAIGLAGIGQPAVLAWAGAAAVVLAVAVLAARLGIATVTVALTLVPFFPASPVVVLADALPGLGLVGLGMAFLCFAAVEPLPRGRTPLLAGLIVLLAFWKAQSPPPGPSEWIAVPEPSGVSEHGRWRAIRDGLPEGAMAVLGEAVFRAEDLAALDFWCRAAEGRDLTLFVGVTEDRGATGRGAVWRLDRETCAPGGVPAIAARAWLGIPGVTGDLLPMPVTAADGTGPDFLICLEGFLPWSWARLAATGAHRDAIVISNDGAFGALPVHAMRRKAAGAMAALLARDVNHAETGRTLLVRAAQGNYDG